MEIKIKGKPEKIEKLFNAIAGNIEQSQSINVSKNKQDIRYLEGYQFNHSSSTHDDNSDK
ncbi:hypothetical protein AALA17_04240 [Lactobacillaceae bacterium 24-114]